MFSHGSTWKWIGLVAIIIWLFQDGIGNHDIWTYFGISVGVYFMFRGSFGRWPHRGQRNSRSEYTEKRKNYTYSDVPPELNLEREDGLNRRIIRASDGEFLVAVEDPATGALYLEESETIR